MGRWADVRHAKVIIILIAVVMGGCVSTHPPQWLTNTTLSRVPVGIEYQRWLNSAPCGVLHVRPPLVNVTGTFTSPVTPSKNVQLLIAPNTTLDGALYAVANCAPLGVARIEHSSDFTFLNLPPGAYVAALPAEAFGQSQGFPIIEEYEVSNYSITMEFYGGNPDYSLAVFSIQRVRS